MATASSPIQSDSLQLIDLTRQHLTQSDLTVRQSATEMMDYSPNTHENDFHEDNRQDNRLDNPIKNLGYFIWAYFRSHIIAQLFADLVTYLQMR